MSLSLAGPAGYARIVWGLTLWLREQPLVEAARVRAAGDLYVMVRHIFPHAISPAIVRGTLTINDGRNLLVNGVWWVSTFQGLLSWRTAPAERDAQGAIAV